MFKVIENCLPSIALHINWVFTLWVKGYDNFRRSILRIKFNSCKTSAKFISEVFAAMNICINRIKVKTKTSVFRFHSCNISSANS